MNLFDSSFLCLDIGTHTVRAIAHRVRSGRITKSAMHTIESTDTIFAIKSVADELEKQIGIHFDSAFITGNFGYGQFEMAAKITSWGTDHKITAGDISRQIAQITPQDGFYPMHVLPLRYDTDAMRNMLTPIGHIDKQLISVFGTIFYEKSRLNEIFSYMRMAHIELDTFFDPSFLQDEIYRQKKQNAVFIDFGAEFTSCSLWTDRGPVFFEKIPMGQKLITNNISAKLNIRHTEADRIKRTVGAAYTSEMDRFTPADTAYDFSRADVNEIILPILLEIITRVKGLLITPISKYNPVKIFLSGGGSGIIGIDGLIENIFNIQSEIIGADASVRALSAHVWNVQEPHVTAYLAQRAKWRNIINRIFSVFINKKIKPAKFIPIMPTTLAFDMQNAETYNLFKSGNISMIHVDIMDGFYVDRIASGIDDLKFIREHTNAHLYVHLMTESPVIWATAAANAGADTIIISTNTAGVRSALRRVHEMGKRCGIALNPDSPIDILKPVLKEIDEILVMAVKPGRGGQKFDDTVLGKISTLVNTRKHYNLKFKIAVDGGINADTAKLCWDAGADFLISGTYLANAPDFPLAVQSLISAKRTI